MTNAKIPFTAEGYAALERDLALLREKREPTLRRLQAAREQGDLSENGAYKAARFELSDIDRNIRRLSSLIKYGEVRAPRQDGVIGFGSTVTLSKDGKHVTYTLVSKHESDPSRGKISLESPLGKSLSGKKQGDAFIVSAPAGDINFHIVAVQ